MHWQVLLEVRDRALMERCTPAVIRAASEEWDVEPRFHPSRLDSVEQVSSLCSSGQEIAISQAASQG